MGPCWCAPASSSPASARRDGRCGSRPRSGHRFYLSTTNPGWSPHMPDNAVDQAVLAGSAPVHDLSVVTLFLQADSIVKAVMLLLLLASFWSWAVIFDKYIKLRRLRRDADNFEEAFWSGGALDDLYDRIGSRPEDPMSSVFAAAMREWRRSMAKRSEEHTSELQSPVHLVCRLLLEKKKMTMKLYVSVKQPLSQHLTPPSSPRCLIYAPATTEIYHLSLHDALPISPTISRRRSGRAARSTISMIASARGPRIRCPRSSPRQCANGGAAWRKDRKSTRLNSSHPSISYAVFCLKKKK